MDIDSILTQYRSNLNIYERFTEKIHHLINELLDLKGLHFALEKRIKSEQSLRNKIVNPEKNYTNPLNQITDICGIRIILRNLADADITSKIIEDEFKTDKANSINKATELNVDQFGYNSVHYIIETHESRTNSTEWKPYANMKAEIQIRTSLQHSWAMVSHSFDYKNSADIPAEFRRRLFRLSALFELADEELDAITTNIRDTLINYTSSLGMGDTKLELNIDSLRVFIDNSKEVKRWQDFIRDSLGITVATWGDLSRDIKFANYCGITNIEQLEQVLINAKSWGEKFFTEYFTVYCERNKATKNTVSVVVNGVVTMLIIATYFEKFTSKILEKEFGWYDGTYLLDIAKHFNNQQHL